MEDLERVLLGDIERSIDQFPGEPDQWLYTFDSTDWRTVENEYNYALNWIEESGKFEIDRTSSGYDHDSLWIYFSSQ